MDIRSNTFERSLSCISKLYDRMEHNIDRLTGAKSGKLFAWLLVTLLSFSVFLFLNILTPLISDDFAYLFIYGENARVESLSDIVHSQINHYYEWSGRAVVHFVAQALLLLPAHMADILNSIVCVSYIFLIYFHIKGREKNSLSLFVLINLAVWFMQPVLGDTVFWLTGAANYLWGTFFILLFLLPYRLYEGSSSGLVLKVGLSVMLFFFGIIAGWTNENTAGAMLLIIIFYCIYYKSHRWQIPMWAVIGFVGGLIGYALLILAPGNFERAGESSLSLYTMAYRLFNCTLTFFYYSGTLLLASLVVTILYLRFKKEEDNNKVLKLSLIYSIAAVAAVYAMFFSPTFPRRALFGVVTFLIIGTGILYYHLDFSQRFLRQMRFVVLLVGTLSFVFTFYLATKDINVYRSMLHEREKKIEQAKQNGILYCEFERYDGSKYIHGEDPFSGELMSRYYGITIKLKNPD